MACGLLEEGAGLAHVYPQQAIPGTSCEDVLAKRIMERKELSPLSLKPASRYTWRAHRSTHFSYTKHNERLIRGMVDTE